MEVTLPDEKAVNNPMLLLPLAGLLSGLLTCLLMPGGQEAGLYSGVVFGFFLAGSLAKSGILALDRLWKAMGLILACTAAYALSAMVAIGFQMNNPQIVPKGESWSMIIASAALGVETTCSRAFLRSCLITASRSRVAASSAPNESTKTFFTCDSASALCAGAPARTVNIRMDERARLKRSVKSDLHNGSCRFDMEVARPTSYNIERERLARNYF